MSIKDKAPKLKRCDKIVDCVFARFFSIRVGGLYGDFIMVNSMFS